MANFIELIKRVVRQELTQRRDSALAIVTAVFPHEAADDVNNYEASVRLKHEGLDLPKVPIAVGHVGISAPPQVDDLVLVQFINGDINQPVITGRFYHAEEHPPLHQNNDIVIEQRRTGDDGPLNQLRFMADGSVLLQRGIDPENPDTVKTSLRMDGSTGDLDIRAGEDKEKQTTIAIAGDTGDLQVVSGDIQIQITYNSEIQINASGKPIKVTCDTLDIEATTTIKGDTTIEGDLTVTNGGNSTTISGNEISGA